MIAKRGFDIALSLVGLLLLAPLFCVISVAIATTDGRPILFRQERVGKDGRVFRIRKFRTMRKGADGPNVSAAGDSRVTRVGRLLRKSKLDELPQLADVLQGRMSLVGPRPEVPEYVEAWPEEARRMILSVRPGITDPASVEFRNESELLNQTDDPEAYYLREILPLKVSRYVSYVEKRTFLGDARLIALTFESVFSGVSKREGQRIA